MGALEILFIIIIIIYLLPWGMSHPNALASLNSSPESLRRKNAVGDFAPAPDSPVTRQVKMIQHKQMAGIHTRRHKSILGAHNYHKCIHTHTHTHIHSHTQKRKKTLHTTDTHACTPLTHSLTHALIQSHTLPINELVRNTL